MHVLVLRQAGEGRWKPIETGIRILGPPTITVRRALFFNFEAAFRQISGVELLQPQVFVQVGGLRR